MTSAIQKILALVALSLAVFIIAGCAVQTQSGSADRRERSQRARAALDDLYRTTPVARKLAEKARGILVFPEIIKGGFVVGGQFGDGVLFKGNTVNGYYRSVSGSYGLQAGVQKFGYALFFLTEKDLQYLNSSQGWEIGVGPSVTLIDEGLARSFTTTTVRDGVYAFFFAQKGLMAGLGIQGTKITRIDP